MLRKRLYLQIYLTIIASLVAVAVLSGLLWPVFGGDQFGRDALEVGARLVHRTLPPANAPKHAQRRAIERLGDELDIDISLFDRQRRLITATGKPGRPPSDRTRRSDWHFGHGGPGWTLLLPDGRWLVANLERRGARHPFFNFVLFLGGIALSVGLVAYPFVRRLTRRLERLQDGVERIGAGDLSARVEVSGRDEVASLATSFNEAAEKIEKLIETHRLLLVNASHELRTPISRIWLGVEMLKKGEDPVRRAALEQDIAELDTLIDEILLMSRLDAGFNAEISQDVDLVALAAEECARYENCIVSGNAPEISGNPDLLRRLVRNLVENAEKYGLPPIEIEFHASDGALTMTVSDGGSGIPEADREKMFQPFYRASGKQNVKGYGLGLPLVRQIAETHGGSVAIKPATDGRFSIKVTLPARKSN
jgi:signal transduction histidine kinase